MSRPTSTTMMRTLFPLRRRALAAAALAALTSALVAAPALAGTPGVDEPPVPGTPRPLEVPSFAEATLPNGVRVVVAERHALPLVSVALYLHLGSAADPEGRAGLAGLTNDLRTQGATVGGKRLSASQLAQQAEALGSSLSSSTDWRGSALTMTVATPKLAEAARLIVDSTLFPTLAASELDRLKQQAADGLKLSLSDPMALAGLTARRAWWGASVFGGSMTPASLARISRKDVQDFARLQLRPELATLVVTGDVTLEQAKALATQLLGSWKGNRMALPKPRAEAAEAQTPSTVLVNLPGAGQSGVVVMAPTVPYDSPERMVARVAGAVLGGGYSARLNQEVRIKRGLSYGAGAGLDFQPVGGVLSARTQTNNATAGQVVQLMRDEIVRMGQELPADDELEARKAALVGSYGRQVETTAGLAGLALDLLGRERPLSEAQHYVPEIQGVTALQVRDYAAKQWSPMALRTVVVGDMSKAAEGLKPVADKPLTLDAKDLDLESPTLMKAR